MGFDDTFKRQWERNKKLDPLTHKALEVVVKQDSKNVKKMARTDAKLMGGEDTWLGRRANDLGDEAQKNEDDPVRGIGRAAATAGAIYGGMALAGAGAGGAGAAAGAAEGAGAAAGAAGAAEGLGAASAAGGGISFGGAASGSGIGLGAGGSAVGTGLGAAGGSGLTLGSAGTSAAGAVTAGEAAGLAGGSGLSSAGFASGIGSSIPEGSAISGSYGASNGFDWQRWTRMQQQGMGQQQQQRPLDQDEVHFDAEGRPYIASSKRLKTNGREPSAALIARGAAGADQIDENGVQIAAIKALKKRIDGLRRRINEVKKKRGQR